MAELVGTLICTHSVATAWVVCKYDRPKMIPHKSVNNLRADFNFGFMAINVEMEQVVNCLKLTGYRLVYTIRMNNLPRKANLCAIDADCFKFISKISFEIIQFKHK